MHLLRKNENCLDDLSGLLDELGISRNNNQHRQYNPEKLIVYLTARTGRRYQVIFWMNEDELIFESVVRKAATGNPSKLSGFYQALLSYNSAMSNINFSLARGSQSWFILLKGSQEYRNVTPKFLINLFALYDLAYSKHVPAIEDIAKEMGINFDGKLSDLVKEFVGFIMN